MNVEELKRRFAKECGVNELDTREADTIEWTVAAMSEDKKVKLIGASWCNKCHDYADNSCLENHIDAIDKSRLTIPQADKSNEAIEGWFTLEDKEPEDRERCIVIQNPKTTATRKPLYGEYDFKEKKFRDPSSSFDGIHLTLAYWSDIILWKPFPKLPNKLFNEAWGRK